MSTILYSGLHWIFYSKVDLTMNRTRALFSCDPEEIRGSVLALAPSVTAQKTLNYYAQFGGVRGADRKAANRRVRCKCTKARDAIVW
jgi:hypothetical protein